MRQLGFWSSCCFGVLIALGSGQAQALPGEPVVEVADWIQANPTINPAPGETLLVRRTDSPSRRFTFQASIHAPGPALAGDRKDIIRSESITLFDLVYGVQQQRLEESLSFIYGDEVYQDYQQAEVVYQYPTAEMLRQADTQNRPLLRLVQGEVRQGNQFAYWVETAQVPGGRPQNGKITVFLLEDLPQVMTILQSR
jgi:hypothetical protein